MLWKKKFIDGQNDVKFGLNYLKRGEMVQYKKEKIPKCISRWHDESGFAYK